MDRIKVLSTVFTIASLYFLWSAINVSFLLFLAYIAAIVIFAVSQYNQHLDGGTTYRVAADKYNYLNVVTIIAVVGFSIAIAGRLIV